MSEADRRRVFLEREDRPPPSYYDNGLGQMPLKKPPFATPNPEEWLKAPEFVPRSRLEDSFNPPEEVIGATIHGNANSLPFAPFDHISPFMQQNFNGAPLSFSSVAPPFPIFPSQPPPVLPPGMVPEGYCANVTHINSGVGPPIPAIVLRKKRRKRNRQTHSVALNSSESPCSSRPIEDSGTDTPDRDPKPLIEEDEYRLEKTAIGGSCPDLSEEQLRLWDEYLFDAAVSANKENKMTNGEEKTSPYEMVPRCLLDVAEQNLDGFSSSEIRKLDKEINGNSMTASMVLQKMTEQNGRVDANGSTEKSLAAELDQIHFRPPLTSYGYPQIDSANVHMATVHHGQVQSKIVPRSKLRRHSFDSDNDYEEEDCFEGMNITINAFDPCEELSLEDNETQTRFEQIHAALKRGTELRPPDRVCCSIQ